MHSKRTFSLALLSLFSFVIGMVTMGLYMLIPLSSQREYSTKLEGTIKELRATNAGK